ncbi:MAG: AAA family ATPase [Oscillospiraceae bacterium]|nr:AAA family ATPase [Oscillospiraceae bacterium]
MKIKNISCTQFAGIRDKDISFEDGINIIYGENESGKSTIVNLLSRTLFQNPKIDGRSDKVFLDLYFPGSLKDGHAGDCADGKIVIETEKGTYTLSKEWGADARCVLSSPDGVIREQNRINDILKDILSYGEGVYADMLLSSQRNSDISLQNLLDASKKTEAKQEITDAVTRAFAERGGISVNAIGEAVAEKIREIEGKHWDFESGKPERKKSGTGRWTKDLGKISEAYYRLEDAEKVLSDINDLEYAVDSAAAEYAEKDKAAENAENEVKKFEDFASRLKERNVLKDRKEELENRLSSYTKAFEAWPKLENELKEAKKLRKEKNSRDILDKYTVAKKSEEEKSELEKKLNRMNCPSDAEISDVKKADREIKSLENKLCGMNIAARIKMLGGNNIEIRSVRTGEIIDISEENISITESVSIVIPGVTEMQLTPADVDTDKIGRQLEKQKAFIAEVYNRYNVDGIEESEQLEKDYKDTQNKLNTVSERLSVTLGNISFDELEKEAKNIGDIREKADIDNDISDLCMGDELSSFITKKETLISTYTDDYGSIDELREKVIKYSAEFENIKNSLADEKDIPEEYLKIQDPRKHLDKLKSDRDDKYKSREDAKDAKTAAETKLDSYTEEHGDSKYNADKADEARREFDEQQALLMHWKHIEQVFIEKKNELSENPMEDLCKYFTRYLEDISGGRVSSEFTLPDKLDMKIYSNNRILDYGKLSEGTKETVSFAFRLAALDRLFPDGGGVAVFDDPFTDMDDERSLQACELLKNFAKRHQVIFLTCKKEYLDKINGNIIYL